MAVDTAQGFEYTSILDTVFSGAYKRIVILTGAGISVNAGIMTYASGRAFGMSSTEVISAAASATKTAIPTLTHWFIKVLDDLGFLLRVYTQNVDGLHALTGMDAKKVVEFHGSKRTKIVQYGDSIPDEAVKQAELDFVRGDSPPPDLLMVMGTSLLVGPFNCLPNLVPCTCKRVLVNLDRIARQHQSKTFTDEYGPHFGAGVRISTSYKIGRRLVTGQQFWYNGQRRYKNQEMHYMDTDDFCRTCMTNYIATMNLAQSSALSQRAVVVPDMYLFLLECTALPARVIRLVAQYL